MSVHVYPLKDGIEHETDDNIGECRCDPRVEYLDQSTGLPYEDGPLIVHNKVGATMDSPGPVSVDARVVAIEGQMRQLRVSTRSIAGELSIANGAGGVLGNVKHGQRVRITFEPIDDEDLVP